MARKIINICVVFALMTGCWGGVLAAAVCPHTDCETTVAAPDVRTTQSEHADGHCHDAADSEDSPSHDKAHEGHAAESPGLDRFLHAEHQSAGFQSRERLCAHCVGSPGAPQSQVVGQQSSTVKRGVDFAAPPAAARVESPAPVFPLKIAPAQHAPPGCTDRHLLLNVFRI